MPGAAPPVARRAEEALVEAAADARDTMPPEPGLEGALRRFADLIGPRPSVVAGSRLESALDGMGDARGEGGSSSLSSRRGAAARRELE
eukprot:11171509-Lingulodinium_polyedra.AAC.1